MRAQITTPTPKPTPAPPKTEEVTKKRGYLPLFNYIFAMRTQKSHPPCAPRPISHAPSDILQYPGFYTAGSASNVSRETNTIRKTIMFHVKQQYATKTSMFHVKHNFSCNIRRGEYLYGLFYKLFRSFGFRYQNSQFRKLIVFYSPALYVDSAILYGIYGSVYRQIE